MPAVLFGSISTIVDTSELQRQAFNQAFHTHGLNWVWDQEDYAQRLEGSGGAQRIADYAESLGQDVDAAAVHATKSEFFQSDVATSVVTTRPGVAETIQAAREAGFKVGLVTTTSAANVAALLEAVREAIPGNSFDIVVDSSDVDDPKPDPAAYLYALKELGEDAASCVAIEDNLGGVDAATAAGLACLAFPNENTAGHAFDKATRVVDRIDLDGLSPFVSAGSSA